MNYQRGMLSDLAPQNNDGLARLLMYLNQPQPMMTGPMMLAQAGNLVDPAKMKGTGVLDEKGNYDATPAPVAPPAGYSQGKNNKVIDNFEEQRRINEAIKYNLPPDSSWDRINAESLKAFQKKQKAK